MRLFGNLIIRSLHIIIILLFRRVKNFVIGSNRSKGLVLEQNVAERLVLLMDPNNDKICKEAILTINSLAKGTEQHLKLIIDAGAVPQLLLNTRAEKFELVEASLRGLRTIFKSKLAPIDLIYSDIDQNLPPEKIQTNKTLLSHLFSLAKQNIPPWNYVVKECIANILAAACQVWFFLL